MAYCYIDQEYNLILNKDAALFVPEFRAIASDEKYGWNFFYYLFLFCSRHPFGALPEDIRDSRVGAIIENFPYTRSQNTRTYGFYKTKVFKKAEEQFKLLYPDIKFDTWMGYGSDIRDINELKSKLNLANDDDMGSLMIYLDALGKLSKLYSDADKDMQADMRKKQTHIAQGALMKEIQED